jgi:hypothetical protein
MVLSTNFYKIGREYLKTRIRQLTKEERKAFIEKIGKRSILFNLGLCLLFAFIGVVSLLYLAIGLTV